MNNKMQENERAIWIIKNNGEQTIKEMAKHLGITVEGARFQLLKLASEGFVKQENRSKGRGRPQQVWSLTEKGQSRFPDKHSKLTVMLIEKIRKTLGNEALQNIIASTGEDHINDYKKYIADDDSLEAKVQKLVSIRESEGYMADYIKNAEDNYLLIENHCPICEAAKACQGFCKAELNVFQTILGERVNVERVDHVLAGARRCAYTIKKL
ncbi:helix-turn-helix transcriptional regulator [Chondrinema litorale]|uniref:helix-turn-helix transcriptional regulator n=1 Tax=Chondrinema litorale TaxID=2994555 RepID=UPI00254372B7|nr:metalloregulator ArsR/SmtB family transcription factor [Chondrinema litorale]UZR96854.1 transcriptional regulator [Chondrinema litorale]